MSIELLRFLNGNCKGNFSKYLEELDREPNIAWYPSAGSDFLALMYLSQKYSEKGFLSYNLELFPEIFLFTDYYPWSDLEFLDSPVLFEDHRVLIKLKSVEELPRLELPVDPEIAYLPKGGVATGRVLFLEVTVESEILGKLVFPVVYACVMNEPFCSKVLLAQNSKIAQIIHIRYGGGVGGGGLASGVWILNVLKRLKCEVFITSAHYPLQYGDKAAYRLYPNLTGEPPLMEQISRLPGLCWSNQGTVLWNAVK